MPYSAEFDGLFIADLEGMIRRGPLLLVIHLNHRSQRLKPSSDVNLIDFGEETAPQKDISERLQQLGNSSPV